MKITSFLKIAKNKSNSDWLVIGIKISIIILISIYLIGNFTPFYASNDGYTIATTAIQISKGNFVYTNELIENTGNFQFVQVTGD